MLQTHKKHTDHLFLSVIISSQMEQWVKMQNFQEAPDFPTWENNCNRGPYKFWRGKDLFSLKGSFPDNGEGGKSRSICSLFNMFTF